MTTQLIGIVSREVDMMMATEIERGLPAQDGRARHIDELRNELRQLVSRLRDGEETIRRGREAGDVIRVRRWESAWIDLLGRYEQVADELASLEGSSSIVR